MESRHHLSPVWAVAFTIVAVVLVLTAAGLFVFNSLRSIPGDVLDGGLEVAGRLYELAGTFQEGTVNTRFISYAAQISGSNLLQVATLKQMEVFAREDQSTVFWGHVELPDVVVAATAPVEYTYFLDLEDSWTFRLENNLLLVSAPAIRFNTPSIDVSELHFDVRSSSLLRDEEPVMESLRLGLMELSRERARDHVTLVRETARRRTRDFVRTWLVGAFSDADEYRVEVVFRDEMPGTTLAPATD